VDLLQKEMMYRVKELNEYEDFVIQWSPVVEAKRSGKYRDERQSSKTGM
jgi:hypothetical protein